MLEVFEVLKNSVLLCQENGHFSAPAGVGYNPQMCQQNQVNAFWEWYFKNCWTVYNKRISCNWTSHTLTLGNLLSPLPNLCSHPIKLHAINEFIELSPPPHTHTPTHKEIGKNWTFLFQIVTFNTVQPRPSCDFSKAETRLICFGPVVSGFKHKLKGRKVYNTVRKM